MKNVTIIGLGYVGLPLACLCIEKGYNVSGVDVDKNKIELINKGVSPIKEDYLIENLKTKKLKATRDFEIIKNSDVVIICVPTPVDKNHYPNLDPVKNSFKEVAKYLKEGQLIILESTVNPGVSEEIIKPILEMSGLKCGKDFYFAHCPERIDPGNEKWTVKNIPRIVGATSPEGKKKAKEFYESILESKVRLMKSIREAEAVKIVENSFRDINIAFVNELAKSFDAMNIDVVDVIEGAATKPFAFMPHFPGCGVGGHCIPVDPYYLIERAKANGFSHEFLNLAREINNKMPKFTVDIVIKILNTLGKSVKGAKIGILGLAYKGNIADTRESPSYEIIKLLRELQADLTIYDPYVLLESDVKSLEEVLNKVEYLLVLTNHSEFKEINSKKLENSNILAIIDGKNCLDKDDFEKSKIAYKGIGR